MLVGRWGGGHGPVGSVNSISSPLTMRSLYPQRTAKKTGPGTLRDQLGQAGWVPHREVEECGQSFPLTEGAPVKDELVSRGRGGSQVKGRCGGKGQASAARDPRPIHTPLACPQQTVQLAKPQSPHRRAKLRSSVFLAGSSWGRPAGSAGLFFVNCKSGQKEFCILALLYQ